MVSIVPPIFPIAPACSDCVTAASAKRSFPAFVRCVTADNRLGAALTPHKAAVRRVMRVAAVVANARLTGPQFKEVVGPDMAEYLGHPVKSQVSSKRMANGLRNIIKCNENSLHF